MKSVCGSGRKNSFWTPFIRPRAPNASGADGDDRLDDLKAGAVVDRATDRGMSARAGAGTALLITRYATAGSAHSAVPRM